MYWTEEQENAVIDYQLATGCEKNRIYKEFLHSPIHKISKGMIGRYEFWKQGITYEDSKDCLIHLFFCLQKFDKERDKKAYSYLSVIARNWFFKKIKTRRFERKKIEELSHVYDCVYKQDTLRYNKEKTLATIKKKIPKREAAAASAMVLKSVYDLIDGNFEQLEKLNKKCFYSHIREKTGLKQKRICKILRSSNLQRYF